MSRLRPPGRPRRWLLTLVAAGVALSMTACGGGSSYSVSPGTLAQRFLPTDRSVSHHPDSLVDLSIEEEDERYTVELKRSYESLHRKWSATYETLGTGRSRPGRSYATFWSLELSLASLEPGRGLSSLSLDQAQQSMNDRREEYQSSIQIDVYWFEGEGETILTGPGSRANLEVNGETYKPQSGEHGPLRDAFLPGTASTALYRRNTFYFKRVVDGTDILAEADGMTLVLNRTGFSSRVRFEWSWPRKSGV